MKSCNESTACSSGRVGVALATAYFSLLPNGIENLQILIRKHRKSVGFRKKSFELEMPPDPHLYVVEPPLVNL
jgi:hypothetical protein